MGIHEPLTAEELFARLEEPLELEFSFLHVDDLVADLAGMPRHRQAFILDWMTRVAATNVQLGFEFAIRADQALQDMEQEMVQDWCLHAMDAYDSSGLHPAMEVIKNLEAYRDTGFMRASGSLLQEASPVLQPFVQGLSGRRLKIEQGDYAWTDGETLYLPEFIARLESKEENFQLYKATVTHLWAQTRFGTLNINLPARLVEFDDPAAAESIFHGLETLRLNALIARELPGLYRKMGEMSAALGETDWPESWGPAATALASVSATAEDSLGWLSSLYPEAPDSRCYQGRMNAAASWRAREERLLRDKARLRESLRLIAEEMAEGDEQHVAPDKFELVEPEPDQQDSAELPVPEIALVDQLLPVPENTRELMRSILLDLGEIPEEYLVPAGPGEYDRQLLDDTGLDPEDVWGGTYHEEGAFFYDEWDFSRQHYRKRWCVLRELTPEIAGLDFHYRTMDRYRGMIKSLHRTFEILRGEDKMLKRQPWGEDVDIDAFVEAWADASMGREMSDRLFTRLHKDERNIAVIFMVDMSGSTKGWINEAEREALILLVEALEILGDRFAIYGFSGWGRKRCEVFSIKTFDEPMDDLARQRICAIAPKDYTRMGAPIRHFTKLLEETEARTKLLITLSDGKPDDYDHYYRGEYGIEDTRQALFHARVAGIHPFCITIDREGADYLPHMYGAANYVVLDDISKLPLKVSDIYRKITT